MNTNISNFYQDDKKTFFFENINSYSSLKIVFSNSLRRIEINTTKNINSGYFEFNTGNIDLIPYGVYSVRGQYSNADGSETESIVFKEIEVLESIFTGNAQIKSYNRKMFDAFEELLQNRAKEDYSSYSIGTRSITKLSPKEMLDLRNYYYEQVVLEEGLNDGKNNGNKIEVRYVGRR